MTPARCSAGSAPASSATSPGRSGASSSRTTRTAAPARGGTDPGARGLRPLIPALVAGALDHRLPRAAAAAVAVLLGVLTLGAGPIAGRPSLIVAGLLYLIAGSSRAWGINRGHSRLRAWANRGMTIVGAVVLAVVVVYPTLLAVDYLAKPRSPVDETALGSAHERVTFPASDGVRLAGWYVPSRNGAAIVLVHGGGGDREGTLRHARKLAGGGDGLLLYE